MSFVPTDSRREADAQAALHTAFAPQSLAIAGVSPRTTGWGGGQMFLRAVRNLDRVPQVYCLNPRGGELDDGTPLYRSLAEVPGPVESLISAVPASAILELIGDAVDKGVKVIHLFTAGFGETGDAERAELEAVVLGKLREAGIRLIGPNCMGIHSTRGGVSWMDDGSSKPGRVGMLSQSGMNASEVVGEGARRGIDFSNVASFGNASDLNEADFLDFLAHDPDTDIVLAYLEGIRNGRRFLRIAREMSQARKPLVVLKGGLTEAGSRAASSHTGSLAGSAQIWNAVQHQGGFMPANSVEELLDLAVTIERMPGVAGPRCAVLGGGGGVSVLAADICDRNEIPVPWFAEQTQQVLREFTPVAGTSIRNPLDAGFMLEGDHMETALNAVADDPSIDWLMVHTGTDGGGPRARQHDQLRQMADGLAAVAPNLRKPLAVVIRQSRTAEGFER
ncbi:MAG: CoA-binding protein, partial [Chloroflexi bacterium]|nr:CoA-binding protein [Chloroflexota bacterium]